MRVGCLLLMVAVGGWAAIGCWFGFCVGLGFGVYLVFGFVDMIMLLSSGLHYCAYGSFAGYTFCFCVVVVWAIDFRYYCTLIVL